MLTARLWKRGTRRRAWGGCWGRRPAGGRLRRLIMTAMPAAASGAGAWGRRGGLCRRRPAQLTPASTRTGMWMLTGYPATMIPGVLATTTSFRYCGLSGMIRRRSSAFSRRFPALPPWRPLLPFPSLRSTPFLPPTRRATPARWPMRRWAILRCPRRPATA